MSALWEKGSQRKAGLHVWGMEVNRDFSVNKLPAMRLMWQAGGMREVQD